MKLTDYIVYCWEDEFGYTKEFATLSEAVKEAKKYTKIHKYYETTIYALSSLTIKNGKIEQIEGD